MVEVDKKYNKNRRRVSRKKWEDEVGPFPLSNIMKLQELQEKLSACVNAYFACAKMSVHCATIGKMMPVSGVPELPEATAVGIRGFLDNAQVEVSKLQDSVFLTAVKETKATKIKNVPPNTVDVVTGLACCVVDGLEALNKYLDGSHPNRADTCSKLRTATNPIDGHIKILASAVGSMIDEFVNRLRLSIESMLAFDEGQKKARNKLKKKKTRSPLLKGKVETDASRETKAGLPPKQNLKIEKKQGLTL